MVHRIFCLAVGLFICYSLESQDTTCQPPTNVRNGSDHLPNQVDLMWTPPVGWIPSPVDRWFEYDYGYWQTLIDLNPDFQYPWSIYIKITDIEIDWKSAVNSITI